jgi:histidinol-phosphate phosphatase family protein
MTLSAVILAGGLGTRLKKYKINTPKALIKFNNTALIENQIKLCIQYKIKKILILLSNDSKKVIDYLSKCSFNNVKISYIVENELLGTGGSLISAKHHLTSRFILFYSDVYLKVDLKRFINYHKYMKADVTIFSHKTDHPEDSDLLNINEITKQVTKIYKYPHKKINKINNLSIAALYIFNRNILNDFLEIKKLDISKDLLEIILNKKKRIISYESNEYIKDAGTVDRIKKIKADLSKKIDEKSMLSYPHKVTFFDRDGTIIRNINYLKKINQIKIIPNVPESILELKKNDFYTHCITNQPVVARGELDEKKIWEHHNHINWEIYKKTKIFIDEFSYCPHHPDSGYVGENKKFKINCKCRKPENLLFKKAQKKINIDINNSWMVGDSWRDILFAKKSKIKSIYLTDDNKNSINDLLFNPDFITDNFSTATNFITNYEKTRNKIKKLLIDKYNYQKIILINGNSFSGKSSSAKIISQILEDEFKIRNTVISTDEFLIPTEFEKKFTSKFNNESILNFIISYNKLKKFLYIRKIYLKKFKKLIDINKIYINPSDTLIIEGTGAFLFNVLCNEKFNVFLNITKKNYQSRLFNKYSSSSNKDIIINKRLNDEFRMINSQKNSSQIVLDII